MSSNFSFSATVKWGRVCLQVKAHQEVQQAWTVLTARPATERGSAVHTEPWALTGLLDTNKGTCSLGLQGHPGCRPSGPGLRSTHTQEGECEGASTSDSTVVSTTAVLGTNLATGARGGGEGRAGPASVRLLHLCTGPSKCVNRIDMASPKLTCVPSLLSSKAQGDSRRDARDRDTRCF